MKKMCLWFESNQWIYIGHTKADSSFSPILKNRFAPQAIRSLSALDRA